MIDLRSLTPEGIERFRELLAAARRHEDETVIPQKVRSALVSLRTSPEARPLATTPRIEVDEKRTFSSRYEFGVYLVRQLAHCDEKVLNSEPGLWAWLALVWIEQFLRGRKGKIAVPRDDNFIPEETKVGSIFWRGWHRHAVRTTWLLVSRYGEKVDFILAGPMHSRGELVEQLTGRADLVLCPPVIEAAAILYRDPRTGRARPGATAKELSNAPVRRFAYLMRQYMVNWDLHAISAERLVRLLPPEFDRWREASARG